MFHPSTRPHFALMACCTVVALLLSFLIVAGWRRHLNMADRRLIMLRADQEQERLSRMKSLKGAQESAQQRSAPPGPAFFTPDSSESLKLSDLVRSQDAPLFPQAEPMLVALAPAREAAAQAVLQRFLKAESWQSKLPLVVDAERVQAAMRDFYERQHLSEPAAEGAAHQTRLRINDTEVLLYSFASSRPGGTTEIALTARQGEPFAVDWESFVGASDMGWTEFKSQRPIKPQLFRVFARFDDYFNYEFSDAAKFLSVHLTSPDGLYFVYGFCERSSPLGRTLSTLQAQGAPQMALTLRLAFSPFAQSDHCVHITGVVANRWLLVP